MVLLIAAAVIFAVLFELNKNSLFGCILAAVIVAAFLFLRKKVLPDRSWILRAGCFLGFLVLMTAVLLLTPGSEKLRPAVPGLRNPVLTEVRNVREGALQGVLTEDGQVEVYAGIPYAAPPVGELRWKPPVDTEPWEGVRVCDRFQPMSYQPANSALYSSLAQIIGYHDYRISLSEHVTDMMSEDSLYLNIWKPAGEVRDLPVLVYVHGGSLMTGQPWYADYSGEGLARKGVIVVNMGYRLGVFGFLADPELQAESPAETTGNYGLLDQIKALQWVRDNISAFGGDPDRVTLAGESAGSACVTALMTSPLAEGLFKYILAESSTVNSREPAHSWRSLEEGFRASEELKAHFNVKTVSELRAIPAEELVYGTNGNHHMTVDGYVIPELPRDAMLSGKCSAEAVMHGFNRTEGKYFMLFDQAKLSNYEEKLKRYFPDRTEEVLELYPAKTDEEARKNWADIYSAWFFTYGHYCLTKQASEAGIPVYAYYFTKENKRLGATHSGEEVYFYGNIPEKSRLYTEEDRILSSRMQDYLVNFMKYGDPNGPGQDESSLPYWASNEDPSRIFELNTDLHETGDPLYPLYGVIDRMLQERGK